MAPLLKLLFRSDFVDVCAMGDWHNGMSFHLSAEVRPLMIMRGLEQKLKYQSNLQAACVPYCT